MFDKIESYELRMKDLKQIIRIFGDRLNNLYRQKWKRAHSMQLKNKLVEGSSKKVDRNIFKMLQVFKIYHSSF